jgi:hypothetical protein
MVINTPEENEILKILLEAKASDALGHDGFHLQNFQNTSENSSKFLEYLIVSIIKTEIWPDKLKIQITRPVFKKGNKKSFDNYRPIAILPSINKIVEKYFAKKIMEFLTKYNIISSKQFGFQKKKGTVEALSYINEYVARALNEGKFVGLVLIDLQKAFDTVSRNILIEKVKICGLRGKICNILENYLSNRCSITKIGNVASKNCHSEAGIPQGSVLGPLLFLLYINDLAADLNIVLFADDICLLASDFKYRKMMTKLQDDFNIIQQWCFENEVFISEEKTVQMDIKTTHSFIHEETFIHLFNNSNNKEYIKLKKVNSAKYLGVQIDKNWKFEDHVNLLIKKLRQILPKLYHITNMLNEKNKKLIYDALVESNIRYGIEVYGNATKTTILRLQKIQNKIIRVLFQRKKPCKVSELMAKEKILNIEGLTDYVIIIKHYFDLSTKFNNLKNKSSMRNVKLKVPLWRNLYGKMRRHYYSNTKFNNLPETLKNLESFSKLKKDLKEHIIQRSKK